MSDGRRKRCSLSFQASLSITRPDADCSSLFINENFSQAITPAARGNVDREIPMAHALRSRQNSPPTVVKRVLKKKKKNWKLQDHSSQCFKMQSQIGFRAFIIVSPHKVVSRSSLVLQWFIFPVGLAVLETHAFVCLHLHSLEAFCCSGKCTLIFFFFFQFSASIFPYCFSIDLVYFGSRDLNTSFFLNRFHLSLTCFQNPNREPTFAQRI